MDQAPKTFNRIKEWKSIELSDHERLAYAMGAKELKGNDAIAPAQFLTPKRVQDHGKDLWTTFNVVQEHMLRGGDKGRHTSGRRTTTRPVKSVTEDLRLNRALWTMTERMAQLVA